MEVSFDSHLGGKMVSKKQSSLEKISEPELSYFELQAYWGVSKPHMGGLKATRELIELCHIDKGIYVLDVGCGVGVTPCYIAKRHGSRVVGVDISEKMVDRARQRAKREGVEDKVEFRVGDAQSLSFGDDLFDVVIGESVIAFVEDKRKGINEYVRVTRPGGYVGLNEATWIKTPPPTELVEYISRITGAKLETSDSWQELLESSGLKDTEVKTYKINALSQFIGEMRYLGLRASLTAWYRFLSLYIRSSNFRRYLKEAWPPKELYRSYFKYLGYGIYVGRKGT